MAIIPKICLLIEQDTSKIYVDDETGVYSANNLGGYGTPNGDRASYAGVLYASYTDYTTGEAALTLTSSQIYYDDTYLNTEKSRFVLNYNKDGWFKFVYSLVPTSALAVEGNIYYSVGEEQLKLYTGGEWTNLTDLSLLDNSNQFQTVKVEKLLDAKLKIEYGNLMEAYNSCTFNCDTCDCLDQKDALVQLRIFLEAAQYRFDSDQKNQAQLMIERLIKIYL